MAEETKVDVEEVVDEVEEVEEVETSAEETVTEAVAACFAEGGAAEGLEGDEAIDAVIAKLEETKGGAVEEGAGFPGLGNEGPPLDLGEAIA